MNIPESLTKILTEAEINEIVAEFDKQVQIATEAKLKQFEDEVYERIVSIVETQEYAHKRQLVTLLENVENKYNDVYKSLNSKYAQAAKKGAANFKNTLAKNIERIVNERVEASIDKSVLTEAARNNSAKVVLDSLRKQLAVDSALMKESVAGPIAENKAKLDECISVIRKLKNERTLLKEQLEQSQADLLLESKLTTLPNAAAKHLRSVLKGQSVKTINESFDYAYRLYRESEDSKREALRNSATSTRSKLADPHTQALVSEGSQNKPAKGKNSFVDMIAEAFE